MFYPYKRREGVRKCFSHAKGGEGVPCEFYPVLCNPTLPVLITDPLYGNWNERLSLGCIFITVLKTSETIDHTIIPYNPMI